MFLTLADVTKTYLYLEGRNNVQNPGNAVASCLMKAFSRFWQPRSRQ
jgi:hypothetical protein